MSETKINTENWTNLLTEAVTKPGTTMKAYSNFWSYSLGNQLLAMCELSAREIPIGPIASFMRWKDLGRYVRKGQKAIALCMPVTGKRTERDKSTGEETEITFTRYIFKNNWFALAQTEGAEYVFPKDMDWTGWGDIHACGPSTVWLAQQTAKTFTGQVVDRDNFGKTWGARE